MSISNVFSLFGGLALFLYGMQMMSDGLEAAAGNKMKEILEKLTANRFLGVLVGALITAVIQSSSATTVMVVGFVNTGLMTLKQAVWIIMGANIGTTITGQLIALDVGELAPLLAFIGVAIIMFSKNEKHHHYAAIIAGLGILFIGMDMMSTSMKPLRDVPEFVNLLTSFSNPILGILAGAIFTAVIQSSSASVGILQALAATGVIGLGSACYVLFGQNIGTCITAFIASIGTSTNAKRTTVIHILFNCIGTIIFTILCMATPIIGFVEGLTPGNTPSQIANLHTIFNIVTTLVLLPFGHLLPVIASKVLKEKEETSDVMHMEDYGIESLGGYAVAHEETRKELVYMLGLAKNNVLDALGMYLGNEVQYEDIHQREKIVDRVNKEITNYITKAMIHENNEEGAYAFTGYFSMASDIERISDHALNIAGYMKTLAEKGVFFSDIALDEIEEMVHTLEGMFDVLLHEEQRYDIMYETVSGYEQKIDDMTKEFRNNMFDRIREGSCSDETSVVFSQILTDFERIGDHALNIAEEYMMQ